MYKWDKATKKRFNGEELLGKEEKGEEGKNVGHFFSSI